MKKYICLYIVEIDDYDGNLSTDHGFLYADSFSDAANQLESNQMYGNSIIKINELTLYDTIFSVSKETYEKVKEELEGQ